MKYDYNLFEDNAGGLHLAVMDGESCVYYLTSLNREFVLDTLEELKNGSDPVNDCWEGGEENPNAAYNTIIRWVEARNGSAWKLDV